MSHIITFSGLPGIGKTALIREILRRHSRATVIPSFTTRRERDWDTVEYEFENISDRAFDDLTFLWIREYGFDRYGTMAKSIDHAIRENDLSLMNVMPDVIPELLLYLVDNDVRCTHLFVCAPPVEELQAQLTTRGEDESSVKKRLAESMTWERLAARSDHLKFHFIKHRAAAEMAHIVLEILS